MLFESMKLHVSIHQHPKNAVKNQLHPIENTSTRKSNAHAPYKCRFVVLTQVNRIYAQRW